MYIVVPLAYYGLSNQTGYEIESQNATHYVVKRLVNECTSTLINSGLCMKTGDLLASSIEVINQAYLRIENPKPTISVYL